MSPGRLVLGVGLVTIGVVLLLEQFEVVDAGEVLATFWPVILIGLGVGMLVANPSHWFPPALLCAVGLMLLAVRLDVVSRRAWGAFWAAMLVMAGVWILLGIGSSRKTEADGGDTVESFVAFWGRQVVNRSGAFAGGSITTLFGGTEVDLAEAAIVDEEVTLTVFTAFGGTEITVPHGWEVGVSGLPLFGGWSNGAKNESAGSGMPRLQVNATVLFGGVEVKHPDARPYP
jgi:predicted membrane protein